MITKMMLESGSPIYVPADSGIVVPYWFACCVLMATRGIDVTIHRIK